MPPIAFQPDTLSFRRSPTARVMICAIAAVTVLAGLLQHSSLIDRAARADEQTTDVDTSHSQWDAHTLNVLLASETDRLSDRGTDPTSDNVFALGWTLDEPTEVQRPYVGTLSVTHDVSECARRGMRTSGRHPPL